MLQNSGVRSVYRFIAAHHIWSFVLVCADVLLKYEHVEAQVFDQVFHTWACLHVCGSVSSTNMQLIF